MIPNLLVSETFRPQQAVLDQLINTFSLHGSVHSMRVPPPEFHEYARSAGYSLDVKAALAGDNYSGWKITPSSIRPITENIQAGDTVRHISGQMNHGLSMHVKEVNLLQAQVIYYDTYDIEVWVNKSFLIIINKAEEPFI